MPSPIEVIINTGSGSVQPEETRQLLEGLFKEHDVEVNIHLAKDGVGIIELARSAVKSDCQIIVAGGGDGTVSGVASELIKTDKSLGVLPLGTLNHFSKDLGIPQDIAQAVRIIAENQVRKIDVGEVNGRIFINNSSIGFYPRIVRKRQKQEHKGRSKWNAAFWATLKIFQLSPFLKVLLKVDNKQFLRETPFVFVGTNEYDMDFFKIGRRDYLDRGELSVYFLRRSGRSGLLRLVFHLITGRLHQSKDFEAVKTEELTIQMRKRLILVAFDGEVAVLRTPLFYKIHPQSLNVIVPKDSPAE
jgi:diacylglycerol kinase family enzyme